MKKLLILNILLLFSSTIFSPKYGYTQDTHQHLPKGAKLVININRDVKVRIKKNESSPDGASIILDWDLDPDKNKEMYIEFPYAVHNVLYSQDGETLVCTSNRAPIHLWNASTGKYIHTLSKYTADVVNVEQKSDWLFHQRIPLHEILHKLEVCATVKRQ